MLCCCRFDTEGVDGYVDTSLWPNRAVCIMPYVMAEGYVILDISIDGGAYNWKGKFFVGESIFFFCKVSKFVRGTHRFELYLVLISIVKYRVIDTTFKRKDEKSCRL